MDHLDDVRTNNDPSNPGAQRPDLQHGPSSDPGHGIDGCMVDALARYREVILYMATFLSQLRRNPRKDTAYDDAVLRSLLEASDVPL